MIVGAWGLYYSHDLSQRNPETLFLTQEGLKDYQQFKEVFVEKNSLVIKKMNRNEDLFYSEVEKLTTFCVDECEIITPKSMKRNSEVKNPELIRLESDHYFALLIMDNSDLNIKKILEYTEKSNYWNASDVSFAGIPYTNFLLDKYSQIIQQKLFPAMFILGLVISLVFVRNLWHSLVVYLPCLFSAGFSLLTLKLLHGEMNMVTSIIPLIVFTVCLSMSFHLYFSLKELKSIRSVLSFKWIPFFLMTFTTYIGFLSLAWADISVIREFGLISAHLVLACSLFAVGWYFLFEDYLVFIENSKRRVLNSTLFKFSLGKVVIGMLGILGIICVIVFSPQLPVITDATEYFPKEDKIKEKIIEVTNSVSGIPLVDVQLMLDNNLNSENVKIVEDVERSLYSKYNDKKIAIISNNRLVEMANSFYSGEKRLPQSFESYLLLRGQLPHGLQESYPVEKNYRLTLLGQPMNFHEYRDHLNTLENVLKLKSIKYKINGLHYNLMLSQEAMIGVLTESFLSSALIIFIFSAFFLKTVKKILIFIFVSLLPVALTFGGMKLFGFSINIATVMTFSISLGMVGDSSFHIIYAKEKRFKNFQEYCEAVLYPVVGSGLLLVVCFGMFTFNSFLPIRQFGGILAIVLFLGTIVDLFVLPTLLYGSIYHQKEYDLTPRS